MFSTYRHLGFIVLLSLVTASCGGGDKPSNPVPVPVNQTPIANAGSDQIVDEDVNVILNGSGSGSDGSIVSYKWTQTSGAEVTLTNNTSETASFNSPNVTTDKVLTFKLNVIDNEGASGTDNISITVRPKNNPLLALWSVPSLSFAGKKFVFTWEDSPDTTHYKVLENADGNSEFIQIGIDIPQGMQRAEYIMPLFERHSAKYTLHTCDQVRCLESDTLTVEDNLVDSIVNIVGNNTEEGDRLGYAVSVSDDGSTLAVGAYEEDSNSTGINGDESNNSALWSGAVYVYQKTSEGWSQEAYIKSSNNEFSDSFGVSVSLSGDGKTLAVGAHNENSAADGINGDQSDNSAEWSGAAYIFQKEEGAWVQEAYIKASDSRRYNYFGTSLILSGDGNTLAVSAPQENSNMTTINGDRSSQFDPPIYDSGAAYLFRRTGSNWIEQAHIKSTDTQQDSGFGEALDLTNDGNTLVVGARKQYSQDAATRTGAVYVFEFDGEKWYQHSRLIGSHSGGSDQFGQSASISGDGTTIAVGARGDSSGASGINPEVTDYGTHDWAGAAYVFVRSSTTWVQQAFIKASNTEELDYFGMSISLSENGNTLAVGANFEGSGVAGVNAEQFDNSESHSGAVYTYSRNGTDWHQTSYLKSSNPKMTDEFGISLQLSNDGLNLIVGANNANNFAGQAYVY